MATLFTSWDEERFPGLQEHMRQLYARSLAGVLSNEESPNKELDEQFINRLFQMIEKYFLSFLKLGYASKTTFPVSLEQLKKIRLISILDESLRNRLNGVTYKYIIAMNPTPGCYPEHDSDTSLELTFYHELGHILTSCNKEDMEYLYKCLDSGDHAKDIEKGFDCLDEVVVQSIAEDVYYDQKGEARPEVKTMQNQIIYPKGEFHSNLAEYRELQEIACSFAKCLGFLQVSENDSMDEVIKKLAKAMLSQNFCYHFYQECVMDPEKMKDFETMLIAMGKIKDAKYGSFGIGTLKREDLDITESIVDFQVLAEKNKSIFIEPEEKVQS